MGFSESSPSNNYIMIPIKVKALYIYFRFPTIPLFFFLYFRSPSTCLLTFTSGSTWSSVTNREALQLWRLSTSSTTAHMKVRPPRRRGRTGRASAQTLGLTRGRCFQGRWTWTPSPMKRSARLWKGWSATSVRLPASYWRWGVQRAICHTAQSRWSHRSLCVFNQEPHPVRLSLEEVEKRKSQLDTCPLSMFEHLSNLKSFFVEVWFLILWFDWIISLFFVVVIKAPACVCRYRASAITSRWSKPWCQRISRIPSSAKGVPTPWWGGTTSETFRN